MRKMVWSDANGCMINKGFTFNGKHYAWNESDEVYYNDATDEDFISLGGSLKLDVMFD